jgi:hypothetical protein
VDEGVGSLTISVDIEKLMDKIVAATRIEERERAVDIIRRWEIYSPYIVGKLRIDDRKQAIIAAIRGDYNEEDYYSGA